MVKQHKIFNITNKEELKIKIWRYMTFEKLSDILNNNVLYFPRSNKLGDPFEGSYTKPSIEQRKIVFNSLLPQKLASKLLDVEIPNFYELVRRYVYVNCWHSSEAESVAMWKQYAEEGKGISIQTTIGSLIKCIKDEENEYLLGFIKYMDFDKDLIRVGNIFNPFFCKRKEYEYEKEFRIATHILIELDPIGKKDTPVGLRRKVDTNLLIEKIIISPYCDKDYKKNIEQITKKFGINNRISKSKLDSEPVF